jgi:hypothetical protein
VADRAAIRADGLPLRQRSCHELEFARRGAAQEPAAACTGDSAAALERSERGADSGALQGDERGEDRLCEP